MPALASPASLERQDTMSISVPSMNSFSNFTRKHAAKGILALAALAVAGAADAAPRPGLYDGTCNVTFTTRAGNCSATNSALFSVTGTQVSLAGGGKVTGGAVAVNISIGLSHASGTGRLTGNSGIGRWSGVISGDRCSGTWQASRT
jgi:type 1 fimbria pilin